MLLRRAEPADALAVARVHVRSWQGAYRGLLPQDYLDGLRPEDRAARYTFGVRDPAAPATIVAEEGSAICGFATTGPARDADVSRDGELLALYVDPAWWGRGVGASLIEAARDALVGRGFGAAILWVLTGNTKAQRFYRRDGWSAEGAQRQNVVHGVHVDEVRYRRRLG